MHDQIVLLQIVFQVENCTATGKRTEESRILAALEFSMPVQVALFSVSAPTRARIRMTFRGARVHRATYGSIASSNTSHPSKSPYIYR